MFQILIVLILTPGFWRRKLLSGKNHFGIISVCCRDRLFDVWAILQFVNNLLFVVSKLSRLWPFLLFVDLLYAHFWRSWFAFLELEILQIYGYGFLAVGICG